jgi:hypothetical protein
MSALDMTSADAVLKELYDKQRVAELTLKNHPLLAMLPKETNFFGRNYPMPLRYANPMGRSKTFSVAQANKVSSKLEQFTLTRVKDYALASIDNETMEATENDAGAFIEALTLEMDGAYQAAAGSISTNLFRDQAASLGQIAAEPANNSGTFNLQLLNVDENVNFEVGMVLVAWSALTGGTQRTSDGADDEWLITAINRRTGVITVSGTYDNSGTLAANDYLFAEGDRGLGIAGLSAWLPTSVTSSPFFGVDRTIDVQRLAGVYDDYSNYSIEEALIKGMKDVALYGGKPSVCFVNYDIWSELELALGSKVQYVNHQVTPEIGFTGIKLSGPNNTVSVVADGSCIPNEAFILQLDTWVLKTLKDAPRVLNSDGLKFLRESDADAIELRVGMYGNLGCFAPAFNGRFKVK